MKRFALVLLALLAVPMSAQNVKGGFVVELDLGPLLARTVGRFRHRNDCNIAIVGYRFRGEPGQQFVYAGETFTVDRDGAIELIADRRRTTFTLTRGGQQIEIESASDQFGFQEATLPEGALPKVRARR